MTGGPGRPPELGTPHMITFNVCLSTISMACANSRAPGQALAGRAFLPDAKAQSVWKA
jgi:hypothetical protein